jgi:hypothetical protein
MITTHDVLSCRYCSHVYFLFGGKQTPADWDAGFGFLAPTYPLIATEFGNCMKSREKERRRREERRQEKTRKRKDGREEREVRKKQREDSSHFISDDCSTPGYVSFLDYMDALAMSFTAWAWFSQNCGYGNERERAKKRERVRESESERKRERRKERKKKHKAQPTELFFFLSFPSLITSWVNPAASLTGPGQLVAAKFGGTISPVEEI